MTDPEKPRDEIETTASLLARARSGDSTSRDRLLARYLPILRRWAAGRLPIAARDLLDTDDLVQITLLKSLDRIESFEPRREGAFLAYLRSILMNQIRDEIRRSRRLPRLEVLDERLAVSGASPLENAIGSEVLAAYEKGLASLGPVQREAIILRLELGFTHEQVAEALELSSADAARMLVARALLKVAEVMDGRA